MAAKRKCKAIYYHWETINPKADRLELHDTVSPTRGDLLGKLL